MVFPAAGLKVFLTASVEERARRRYKQLKDKGMDVSLPALSRDMEERDRRDSERSVAPLRAAEDARVLDSTELDIQEVVDTVASWAQRSLLTLGFLKVRHAPGSKRHGSGRQDLSTGFFINRATVFVLGSYSLTTGPPQGGLLNVRKFCRTVRAKSCQQSN